MGSSRSESAKGAPLSVARFSTISTSSPASTGTAIAARTQDPEIGEGPGGIVFPREENRVSLFDPPLERGDG